MQAPPTSYKRFFRLGLAAHAVLVVLAWLYWRERTHFADISLHLFELVRQRGLAIQGHRFVAAATQIIPLAGVWSGASLSQLAHLYSLAFPLFYIGCYMLCGPVLKQYALALTLLLTQTLLASDTFYWIQSELPQGLSLLLVVLALLRQPFWMTGRGLLQLIAVALGIATVGFAHPLLLFPALYACAFFGLGAPSRAGRLKWLLAGAALLAAFLVKRLFFRDAYDDQATPGLRTLYNQVGCITQADSLKTFLLDCLRKFYAFPVVLTWAGIHYIRRRRYRMFLLVALGSLGYAVLVIATHPDASTPAFYMENLCLPLGLFLALPLAFHLLPGLRSRRLQAGVVAVILAAGVVRMAAYHTVYTTRLHWMERFVAHHPHEKLLIPQAAVPLDTLLITWGTPYEFWLLSTLKGGPTASLLITDHPQDYASGAERHNAFLGTWGAYPYQELPRRYFRFQDSVTSYRVVAAP